MTSIPDLDSRELAARIEELVGRERSVQADFLLHLMEFDRRRDYLTAGYCSLWEYVQRKLGYPENATFRRTHAVRVLHRFPEAVDCLRDGRLSMTTLVLLEPALTGANAGQLFAAASGKSKRQVEEFLASQKAPGPVPMATIRRLPERAMAVPVAAMDPASAPPGPALSSPENPRRAEPSSVVAPVPPSPLPPLPLPSWPPSPSPRRPLVEPIAANQYRISMVVTGEFVEALREAQRILSHSIPNGDVAAVLRRGLAGILEKHGKRVGTIPVRKRNATPGQKPSTEPIAS